MRPVGSCATSEWRADAASRHLTALPNNVKHSAVSARRSPAKPGLKKKDSGPSTRPSKSRLRRDVEKATTRRLILETARAMFTREGYANTTMRRIADEIGYTATAIYHHFADKDALLYELCDTDFRAFAAALRSIGGITDPVERIRQMGRNYVRFAVEHPEQFRFIFLTSRPADGPSEPGQLTPAEGGYEFLKAAVSEAIAAGRFRPELGDAELVAQVLWAGVHGIATIHVMMPPGSQSAIDLRDPEQTAVTACEALLRGLLRTP